MRAVDSLVAARKDPCRPGCLSGDQVYPERCGAPPTSQGRNLLVLGGMAREKLPATKPVGTNLSFEVIEALDKAVEERGLSKRALLEIALRRELGLPDYPGVHEPAQETLPMSA